jgi:tRNA pseudouridine13 synthase
MYLTVRFIFLVKTGIAVLQGDFRKAIDVFMSPKPDDRPDAARGRLDWQNRFKDGESREKEAEAAKRIIRCLNRFMTAETSAMQSLSRFPQDYRRAFRCIPKTLRMMFLHAVQSLVWNRAASHRIRLSRNEVLIGDLVMVEGPSESPKVHVVSKADMDSSRFSILDVVLPLIGTKSEFPTNEMGDLMKRLLSELGVSIGSFKEVQDNDLALNGDYRKLLVRPTDFTFEIKEYFDPKQPLLQTDLMALNNEEIEIAPPEEGQNKKIAMIVGFTLPSSSYATVALRELMKKPTSSEYQKDLKLE